MRRTLLILTLLAGLAVAAGATEQVIPASEFDLADHAGKVVVVDVAQEYYAVVGENLMKFAH